MRRAIVPVALLGLALLAVPARAQDAASPGTGGAASDAQAQSEPGQSEPGQSEPGQVTVVLSPDETTVGGRVRAEITVVWMGGAPKEPVRFPTWQGEWGDAEILESSPVEAFEDQSGRHVARQVLELVAFEAGDVDLPPRTFAVPLAERTVELDSQPARFVVTSVLPADGSSEPGRSQDGPSQNGQSQNGQAQNGRAGDGREQDGEQDPAPQGAGQAAELEPRGAAPPAALESAPAPFYASVAALAALFVLGLGQLRRELAREVPGPAATAEIDALAALEPLEELMARLEQLDPLHGGAAHTGLSLALRRYLGRRLGFNAVESTTTEIQRQLLQGTAVKPPADLAQRSLALLRAADLVKFAGLEADAHTVRTRIEEAREIGRGVEAQIERPGPLAADTAASEAA